MSKYIYACVGLLKIVLIVRESECSTFYEVNFTFPPSSMNTFSPLLTLYIHFSLSFTFLFYFSILVYFSVMTLIYLLCFVMHLDERDSHKHVHCSSSGRASDIIKTKQRKVTPVEKDLLRNTVTCPYPLFSLSHSLMITRKAFSQYIDYCTSDYTLEGPSSFFFLLL